MAIYIIIGIVSMVISWILFYYVVKAAVKNGIQESRDNLALQTAHTPGRPATPERPANTEQIKLQQRYDRGEITFKEYQSEWNRLG